MELGIVGLLGVMKGRGADPPTTGPTNVRSRKTGSPQSLQQVKKGWADCKAVWVATTLKTLSS